MKIIDYNTNIVKLFALEYVKSNNIPKQTKIILYKFIKDASIHEVWNLLFFGKPEKLSPKGEKILEMFIYNSSNENISEFLWLSAIPMFKNLISYKNKYDEFKNEYKENINKVNDILKNNKEKLKFNEREIDNIINKIKFLEKTGKVIGVSLLIALIVFIGKAIYVNKFSKAGIYCKDKIGIHKKLCIKKFIKDAIEMEIRQLEDDKELCQYSDNRKKCEYLIDKRIIDKYKKITKLRI